MDKKRIINTEFNTNLTVKVVFKLNNNCGDFSEYEENTNFPIIGLYICTNFCVLYVFFCNVLVKYRYLLHEVAEFFTHKNIQLILIF